MRRLWFSVLVSVCILAVSFNANAQTNDPNARQAFAEHAANLPVAEAIAARVEAAAGRPLDPLYRAEAVRKLSGLSAAALGDVASGDGLGADIYGQSATDLVFVPVPPCRVFDTRPGFLVPGPVYTFFVAGTCGIPFGSAVGVALNFIAVSGVGTGFVQVGPTGAPIPFASVINYQAGIAAIANGIDMKICDPNAGPCPTDIQVSIGGAAVQLVADVYGYYQRLPPAGRAVAVVDGGVGPFFDAARTRNFAAIVRVGVGNYCLTPGGVAGIPAINPATSPAYVTVEWGSSSGFLLAAFHNKFGMGGAGPTAACPSPTTQFQILTYNFSGAPSDSVSFEVFVP